MPFLLAADDPERLTAWLHGHGLLLGDAVRELEVAGEGNMNLVLRAFSAAGTLVIKQSRPYVQRYPQIPAPVGRTEVEAAWYAAVADVPALAARTPRLRLHDPTDHVLVMDDLGPTRDLSGIYAGAPLASHVHADVLAFLATLHAQRPAPTDLLRNRAMRQLNHAHIFDLPFRETPPTDLDAITPGFAASAAAVAADAPLVRRVHDLGRRYLADGTTLLHGDLYPGSMVHTERGLFVLDPEFGFLGEPAFDRGVWLGHLVLARQPAEVLATATDGAPPGTRGFAGVEILRRLLGVAQLALPIDLSAKQAMIDQARAWIVEDA